jgi:hypothetical protein
MKRSQEGNWSSCLRSQISKNNAKYNSLDSSLSEDIKFREDKNVSLEEAGVYLKMKVLFVLCPNCARDNYRIFKHTIICFSGSVFIQFFFRIVWILGCKDSFYFSDNIKKVRNISQRQESFLSISKTYLYIFQWTGLEQEVNFRTKQLRKD